MDTTTVAALRPILGRYFGRPETDTCLRVLREAGTIPQGASGRDGCRSAQLDARQAALVLLALASPGHPKNCATEAERLGGFRLLKRVTEQAPGEEPRSFAAQHQLNLLTALELQLARTADGDYEPVGWNIGPHTATERAIDRWIFGDGEQADEVERWCAITARLLADIAQLFQVSKAEAA